MNIKNPTWPGKEGRSENEVFDSLLKYRRLASLSVERLRIVKELERLLTEDKAKFTEYLSDTIHLYETECEFSLDDVSGIHHNTDIDPPAYVDNEGYIVDINDFYYDKNTTVVQYLDEKRHLILDYLHELKSLWNKGQKEKVTARLKEAHDQDVSQIFNSKKIIEDEFSILENMTMAAIKESSDTKKNDELRKSLEKMRNDLRGAGFIP
jgi:hypothetical protein